MNISTNLKTITCASALMLVSLPASAATTGNISGSHAVSDNSELVVETITPDLDSNAYLKITHNDSNGWKVTATPTNGGFLREGQSSTTAANQIEFTITCPNVTDVGTNTIASEGEVSMNLQTAAILFTKSSPTAPVYQAESDCTWASDDDAIATHHFSGTYSDTVTFTLTTLSSA